MLIQMHLVMNPHQRCLQAKVKYRNEPKQVMPKSEDPRRSLEINAIWTFDTEYITVHIVYHSISQYVKVYKTISYNEISFGFIASYPP